VSHDVRFGEFFRPAVREYRVYLGHGADVSDVVGRVQAGNVRVELRHVHQVHHRDVIFLENRAVVTQESRSTCIQANSSRLEE
jgi:hypothetical protein